MLHVQLGTRRLLHFGARPSHFAPFPGRLLLPADSEIRHRGVKKKGGEREKRWKRRRRGES